MHKSARIGIFKSDKIVWVWKSSKVKTFAGPNPYKDLQFSNIDFQSFNIRKHMRNILESNFPIWHSSYPTPRKALKTDITKLRYFHLHNYTILSLVNGMMNDIVQETVGSNLPIQNTNPDTLAITNNAMTWWAHTVWDQSNMSSCRTRTVLPKEERLTLALWNAPLSSAGRTRGSNSRAGNEI